MDMVNLDTGRDVEQLMDELHHVIRWQPRGAEAHVDLLEGRLAGRRYDAPLVAEGAQVDTNARIGSRVVLGAGAVVEEDAWVEDSVLHAGAVVQRNATVSRSILGPASRVGFGAVAEGVVLAEGAEVAPEARAEGDGAGTGGEAVAAIGQVEGV